MASQSETGHARNVATFKELITYCAAYGSSYNPSKSLLALTSLQQSADDAAVVTKEAKAEYTAYQKTTNARQLVYEQLKPFATKVVNALAATDADKLAVANARSANRKIQGAGKKSKNVTPENEEESSKSISRSQQSYDNLASNFFQLTEIVTQDKNYTPNEPGLQKTALTARYDELLAANKTVSDQATKYSNAMLRRDEKLYGREAGLYAIQSAVKKYVKSVFGATSSQFKQISGLEFSNKRNK